MKKLSLGKSLTVNLDGLLIVFIIKGNEIAQDFARRFIIGWTWIQAPKRSQTTLFLWLDLVSDVDDFKMSLIKFKTHST